MDNLLILESAKDFEKLTYIPDNPLEGSKAYEPFLQRAKKAYDVYHKTFVGSDYRPYQPEYAALMCLRRYNIMAYGMGCAKTSISLLTISVLYGDLFNKLRGVLVRPGLVHITVPSLLSAGRWIEELERMPSLKDHYQVISKERQLESCTKPILIYTHDFAKGSCLKPGTTHKIKRSRFIGRYRRPAYLIIDEGHGLKSTTDRTKNLKYIRDRSRRVLLLSGTLSDGNLAQIHNICSFVYKRHWPYKTAQTFSQIYGQKARLPTNYLYGSAKQKNLPEKYLQQLDKTKIASYYNLVNRFIHRVRIDEPQVAAYVTIPEQDVQIHALQPTDEQITKLKEYVTTHKQQLIAAASTGNTHTAEALRLIHPLIRLCNSPTEVTHKARKVLELIKASEGKVIIFCSYVPSSRLLTEYLSRHLEPRSVVRLYAQDIYVTPRQLSAEQRQERVNAFQYDSAVKVAVLSTNLASESIDLTKASAVIHYCLSWSSIKLLQSTARAVRPGNRNKKVSIHYLFQKGMIDEHQVALSIEKIKGSKLLLDYEVDSSADQDLSPSEVIRRLLAN